MDIDFYISYLLELDRNIYRYKDLKHFGLSKKDWNIIRKDDRVSNRIRTKKNKLKESVIIEDNKYQKYSEYLRSKRWIKIRNKIRKKHDFKCAICNEKGRDVHHSTYKNKGKSNEINDLVFLCRRCHQLVHDNIRIK